MSGGAGTSTALGMFVVDVSIYLRQSYTSPYARVCVRLCVCVQWPTVYAQWHRDMVG